MFLFGPKLGDFFCPERFGYFYLTQEVGLFFCPERLVDFFLSQEVG